MGNVYLTKSNLAGVIVIYNPGDDVAHNIISYIDFLSKLYVIDNTDNPQASLPQKLTEISPKIDYRCFEQNLGIARALNEGCNAALKDGYDWILTMDQDSFFPGGDFFNLLFNNRYPGVAIIAASYNHIHFSPKVSTIDSFIQVDFVISSGNVLNLDVWRQLSGFTEKLFIDEVDNDFCIRCRNIGFKILTSKLIFLKHRLGEELNIKYFLPGKRNRISKHSPLRVYYISRNNLYLWKKYFFTNTYFVLNRMKKILILFLKIIAYFPDKKTYLNFFFKGISDSLKGRYGKFPN